MNYLFTEPHCKHKKTWNACGDCRPALTNQKYLEILWKNRGLLKNDFITEADQTLTAVITEERNRIKGICEGMDRLSYYTTNGDAFPVISLRDFIKLLTQE